MVEMQVFGLAMDEQNKAPILILKDVAEEKVLPIWIGAMEAMSISLALNNVDFPRPMTHDLLLNVLTELGVGVESVEIVRMEEGTFYAELVLGERERRVDCRPSDAIALAVRVEAPVFVAEEVLEQAGIQSGESRYAVFETEEAQQWTEELENISEDDFKYKM
ncbi:hypothetical protein SAMN02745704_01012 [Paucidesulfovibrio gracilis DSM 16080]|uniref:BFN domain-containing protein n=1 Tax=Paucidesulfovibrio gracilis DSM 16080 TaxID=1121449 RepID=A0A1T4WJX6_9BACT|nr:bifunctional nuclease family protein [Paucidesulfovibrio gracilis]SKA77633.1 hypothetical protein SAMN02745704_01012 [Paucidesulfovibrio gracilis DSM 16080]